MHPFFIATMTRNPCTDAYYIGSHTQSCALSDDGGKGYGNVEGHARTVPIIHHDDNEDHDEGGC